MQFRGIFHKTVGTRDGGAKRREILLGKAGDCDLFREIGLDKFYGVILYRCVEQGNLEQ